MPIQYRPMRPKDICECAELVLSHPAIGPRYQGCDLRSAWLRLLGCEAKTAAVLEDVDRERARICGVGVSVFVTEDFLNQIKTPPLVWIGPELAKRMLGSGSPLLSGRQLRQANTCGGLNLLTWEGCIRLQDADRPEVYNQLIAAFMEFHRGFLWKEIIGAQAESTQRLQNMLRSGGMCWDSAAGSYLDWQNQDAEQFVLGPHVIGLSRDVEVRRPGSWVGNLFDYRPPQFGFTTSEQSLLLAALRGGTDEDLSAELALSLSAVKKTWLGIYHRVARASPDVIPAEAQADGEKRDRGREKKQRLIAYLRDHPEELRPYSRKMLSPQLELSTCFAGAGTAEPLRVGLAARAGKNAASSDAQTSTRIAARVPLGFRVSPKP